jgi:hypothetical protein
MLIEGSEPSPELKLGPLPSLVVAGYERNEPEAEGRF